MSGDSKLEAVTAVPDRAMVIFAHPDDAEIGSGGVVAKWVAQGCEVTYVLCTNGGAGTADRSLTPAQLTARRADEQRAAADFMGVRHVVMLGYPDGGLEDTREFLGDVVRAIRRHRPDTVFVHDPYRMKSFQHRDHRKAGIVTTDAIYPFARDHLHFPEHVEQEGLEPHKVRELWYWGADEPDVIVDVTDSIDRQVAALIRHESQMAGFNVPDGDTHRRARQAPGRRAGSRLRLHLRRGVPPAGRAAVDPAEARRQRTSSRGQAPTSASAGGQRHQRAGHPVVRGLVSRSWSRMARRPAVSINVWA